MTSFVAGLECARCGARASHRERAHLCRECDGPYLVRYDLGRVRASVARADLERREASLWRYRELLPHEDAAGAVSLGEGMTPLLALPRLGERLGLPGLATKDEGLLPTGTFKARG
ncbi:MAG: threonine synthase, partial [Candidatus Limnocylindria bacterium]